MAHDDSIRPHGNTTHGMSGTLIYDVWCAIRKRCENPNDPGWKNYGGRGITVCDRWKQFSNFYADVGDPPADGMELDRIDNERGYELNNVRWTTRTINQRNRRTNRVLTLNGESHALSEWSELRGMKVITLWQRIYAYSWSVERALTEPVDKRRSHG